MESLLGRPSERIEVVHDQFTGAATRLTTFPRASQRASKTVHAEIGPRKVQFPTAGHVATLAGMSPGDSESAGNQLSDHTMRGNRRPRQTLAQAAWAVIAGGGGTTQSSSSARSRASAT